MSAMYCQYGGKVRFPTLAKARKAADGMMQRRPQAKVSHYQCEHCKDWHIANDTQRVNKRKNSR